MPHTAKQNLTSNLFTENTLKFENGKKDLPQFHPPTTHTAPYEHAERKASSTVPESSSGTTRTRECLEEGGRV
jgi:hypothetical protein